MIAACSTVKEKEFKMCTRSVKIALTLALSGCLFASPFSPVKADTKSIGITLTKRTVQGYWPISNSADTTADVLTSAFGARKLDNDPFDFHEGIDISAENLSVHAAFSGTIFEVNYPSNSTSDHWVVLEHVDLDEPDVYFYTRYHHLRRDSQLASLQTRIGEEITGGQLSSINPFATSDKTGTTYYHLHFAGTIYYHEPAYNAINPMRRDSLPYSNASAPHPYNIKSDSGSNILDFDVNTRGRELDLNRIVVVNILDSIVIDFDERINSDNQFYGGNEDGYQETTTAQGHAVIIWIYPYAFPTLNDFQRIYFAFQPPSFWNHNFTELFVRDTQDNQTHVWTSV